MAEQAPPAGASFNFKAAISEMVRRNGSDLLLKVGRPATIRVNGGLEGLNQQPLKPEELKSLAEQIMTPRQVKEFAEHKKADFAIGVPGVGRFRIIKIEDPIEFLHRDNLSNSSQREVGNDTLSFNSALRHVLRQDPDVLLIGEIRDQETLDTALKAADTGHLVFSTLHTTDTTQTISRVISFFPPHQHDEIRHLLSTALQAVISLRLVPRKDGKGRVPAAEVLINTAAVADNIRDLSKQLSIPDLIAEGSIQYGMQSFDQSLFQWYQQGVISYESAIFYASNPSEFALKVSGVDSSGSKIGASRAGA